MLAGHDTTAVSLTWWLWEMAKDPIWQTRVREEIKEARVKVQDRGDADLGLQDLEGMSAMQATLKVGCTSSGQLRRFLIRMHAGGYASSPNRYGAWAGSWPGRRHPARVPYHVQVWRTDHGDPCQEGSDDQHRYRIV